MKKNRYIVIMALLAFPLLLGIVSCGKEEFLPPPEGEQVPYTDSTQALREALAGSPYSLYWTAWQRSHMNDIISALGPKTAFTLLVPDNAAMEAAGFGLAAINRTPAVVLDSLLRFHSSTGQLMPDALSRLSGNLLFITLQTNDALLESYGEFGGSSQRTYHYRHYLTIENGNLLVNGREAGPASRAIIVPHGTLLPISQVLARPLKDMRQTLEDDGRFSLYLAIRAYSEEEYAALGGNSVYPLLDLMSANPQLPATWFSSILAPTDDAFHQAGINSLDDVKELNSRSMPYLRDDYFTMSGYLPSDSILNNHYWNMNTLYVLSNAPESISDYKSPWFNTPLTFYSNDLKNEILGDYITMYDSWTNTPLEVNNLEFIRSGEDIKVRMKGSEATPATLIERDIQTLNGPVHVLDRLLLPPSFKLH